MDSPIVMKTLTAIDSFALYFTSGAADEQVAFTAVGKSFCDTIRSVLIYYFGMKHINYFENTIKLFNIWEARLKTQKLIEDREQIKAQIEKIEAKKITPVGVD